MSEAALEAMKYQVSIGIADPRGSRCGLGAERNYSPNSVLLPGG